MCKQCVRCWKVPLLPHTVSWDFVFTDICVSASLAPGKDGIFRFISPSLAPHHFLLPFLIDTTSLGLTVILGIHTVTFGFSYFRLSCVQLFIQQKWWIFRFFKEILPSHLSLSAAGDTKAPGFNLAHLHSREKKREKKNTRCVCVFFISHSSKQKNKLIFMCYFITLIRYFIWQSVVFARGFEQIFKY